MRLASIIQIGRVVGDLVSQIDQLRFQRRPQIEQILRQFRMLASIVIVRVLDNPFAYLKGQIEAAKSGVAKLEVFSNSQRVQIVVEKESMLPHRCIQRLLPGMPKRRMPNVMHQRQCLDQIRIETKLRGNRTRYLRDLNRVGEAVAKMIGVPPRKDLRLRLESTKRPGMHHAIAIALKVIAVKMRRLRMAASTRLLHVHRIVSEHAKSLAVETRLTPFLRVADARKGRPGKNTAHALDRPLGRLYISV